jgi:hypothetical protein
MRLRALAVEQTLLEYAGISVARDMHSPQSENPDAAYREREDDDGNEEQRVEEDALTLELGVED